MANDFILGRSVTLDIIGPAGPINFNILTSFEAKPSYHRVKSTAITGVSKQKAIEEEWTGSFSLDRSDARVDNFFRDRAAAQRNNITPPAASITETIQEIDGSISQYRFLDVDLTYDEAGNFAGNDKVAQKIGFTASMRV